MKNLVLIFTVLSPSIAFAYLDPGTGGMLMQIIGGIGIALVTFYQFFKENIKNVFRKLSGKKEVVKGEDNKFIKSDE